MENKRSRVLKRAQLRRKKEHYRKMLRFAFTFALIMTVVSTALTIRSFANDKMDDSPRSKYYTSIEIGKGDTVNSIASRYISAEYSSKKEYISEIVELNHLTDINDIHAGDHLIVPYYYAMK